MLEFVLRDRLHFLAEISMRSLSACVLENIITPKHSCDKFQFIGRKKGKFNKQENWRDSGRLSYDCHQTKTIIAHFYRYPIITGG